MKKILLASTAIVGGALMASSAATAGNVTSGDNYSVALGGIHRFMIGQYDNDAAGTSRGYGVAAPFTEINVKATAQADNGIKYGVTIEIETRGDAGNVADEFYAIVEGDSWGRVELGGNDGAADRMNISGANALVATGGYSGGLGMRQFAGTFNAVTNGISRWDGAISGSGDTVKVIYFTPRFSGFQLGASLTPTTDNNGRGATTEGSPTNTADVENLFELGANYVGKFGDFGVIVAGTYQKGDATVGGVEGEDHQVWSVGGSVAYAGFTLAAGYEDLDDTGLAKNAAGDAGNVWNVGLGYKTGPWGVSGGYQYGERDLATGDADVGVIAVGAQYSVAPGWTAMAELGLWDVDNGPGTGNDDHEVFMVVNQFVF